MVNKIQSTPVKDTKVVLSSESYRQQIALRRLKANEGKKMLSQDDIPRYLASRIKALYERVKIDGALTYDKVPEYLAQFAKEAGSVLSERAPGKQRKIVEKFNQSTNQILDQISEDVDIEPDKLKNYKSEIARKSVQLNSNDIGKRFEAVQDIGAKITEAATKSEKELTAKDLKPQKKKSLTQTELQAILNQEIIPIGFEKSASLITVGAFYGFPFGKTPPNDDNWFEMHIRYLDDLSESNKIAEKECLLAKSVLPFLPKTKYKKYFNIYPNDKFEDSILMAVFSLYNNQAFDKLKIS